MRSPETLVAELEQRLPGTVLLAECVSVATRVETELLRAIRLTFARQVPVEVEAELWFSPLVAVRTLDGFTLRQQYAEALVRRLAKRLHGADVAAFVASFHRDRGSPSIALEEQIRWLSIAGGSESLVRVDELLRSALAAMLDTPTRASAVAAWAMGALSRLPKNALRTEGARLLRFAAATRVGAPAVPLDGSDQGFPPGAHEVVAGDALQRVVRIGVRREGADLFFTEPNGAHVLDLPATRPAVVELQWTESAGEHRRVVVAAPGRRVLLGRATGLVVLRSIVGKRWVVEPVSGGVGAEANPLAARVQDAMVTVRGERPEHLGYLVASDCVVATVSAVERVSLGGVVSVHHRSDKTEATVESVDPAADVAVLRLRRPLPGALPLLVTPEPNGPFEAFGPSVHVRGTVGLRETQLKMSQAAIEPDEERMLWVDGPLAGLLAPGTPLIRDGRVVGHITSRRNDSGVSAVPALVISETIGAPRFDPSRVPTSAYFAEVIANEVRQQRNVAVVGRAGGGKSVTLDLVAAQLRREGAVVVRHSMRSKTGTSLRAALAGAARQAEQAAENVASPGFIVLVVDGVDGAREIEQLELVWRSLHGVHWVLATRDIGLLESAPFRFTSVRIDELDVEQFGAVVRRVAPDADHAALDALHSMLGRDRALLELAVNEFSRNPQTLAQALLDPQSASFKRAFGRHLEPIRQWLQKNPGALTVLGVLRRAERVRSAASNLTGLQRLGVLTEDHRLRAPLYLRAFGLEELEIRFDVEAARRRGLVWEGQAKEGNLVLSALIARRGLHWYTVHLTLTRDDGEPIEGVVRFRLHESFDPPEREVRPVQGIATLVLEAYGAFSVNAVVTDLSQPPVTLDLATLGGAHVDFLHDGNPPSHLESRARREREWVSAGMGPVEA